MSRKKVRKILLAAIGVSNYSGKSGFKSLPPAANDASDVFQAIRSRTEYHMNEKESILLTGDPSGVVTRTEILTSISSVSEAAGSNDMVLIYFSGHGDRMRDSGDSGLLLVPSDLVDADDAGDYVSLTRVESILNKSAAKLKIIILDACYSGPETTLFVPKGLRLTKKYIEQSLATASGCIKLASSGLTQESFTLKGERNSFFTKWLLRALSGDYEALSNESILTFDSLYAYLCAKIDAEAKSKKLKQGPCRSVADSGLVVLADFSTKKVVSTGWTFAANVHLHLTANEEVPTESILTEWRNPRIGVDTLEWATGRALARHLEDTTYAEFKADFLSSFPNEFTTVQIEGTTLTFRDGDIDCQHEMSGKHRIILSYGLSVSGRWTMDREDFEELLNLTELRWESHLTANFTGHFSLDPSRYLQIGWKVTAIKPDSIVCAGPDSLKAEVTAHRLTVLRLPVSEFLSPELFGKWELVFHLWSAIKDLHTSSVGKLGPPWRRALPDFNG